MKTARKTCFKCGETKAITEFYRHPMMGDGRLGKCRDCTRRDVKENREKRLDYYREYDRRRGRRPGPPNKERARRALNHAIVNGSMKIGSCVIGVGCKGRMEGHHPDYSKPLHVVWLCKKHHAEVHTKDAMK